MMLRQSARLQRQFAHGAIVQTPRTRSTTTTGKLHPSCAILSKRAAVVGLLSGLFVAGGASVPGSRSVAMAASASEIEKVYHCMCVHMPFTATCCMHDVLLFNFHSRLAPLTSTGSHHLLAPGAKVTTRRSSAVLPG